MGIVRGILVFTPPPKWINMHDFNIIPYPMGHPRNCYSNFCSQLGGSNCLLERIHKPRFLVTLTPHPNDLMLFRAEESFPDIGYIDTKHMQAHLHLDTFLTNSSRQQSHQLIQWFLSKSTPSCQIFVPCIQTCNSMSLPKPNFCHLRILVR